MPGNNAVIAYHTAIHDGGIDAYQAVVTYGAAMDGAMMGDGAMAAYDGRGLVTYVQHDKVLDIGIGTNDDFLMLRPGHHIHPD